MRVSANWVAPPVLGGGSSCARSREYPARRGLKDESTWKREFPCCRSCYVSHVHMHLVSDNNGLYMGETHLVEICPPRIKLSD